MRATHIQAPREHRITGANILALGLELTGLAALSIWGWDRLGWVGALTLPLALAALWGTLLSHRASRPITDLAWLAATLAVFSTCAFALNAVAGPGAAASFLALALLSTTLGGSR